MKLYINTALMDKIVVNLNGQGYTSSARQKSSQLLLTLISEALSSQRSTLKDLTDIEVFTGPGSFTGLRVGVAVAQTLGWSLQIPVNGKLFSEVNFLEIAYS